MLRHVAPQCIAPTLVIFSASLGSAIFAEAALSFLGLGIPQPNPSWGNMLGGILADQFRPKWWLVHLPRSDDHRDGAGLQSARRCAARLS